MLLVVVPVIVMTFLFAWKYRASNTNAITRRMVALHQDRDRGVDCSDPDHHRPGLHHLQVDPQAGPVPSAGIRREAGDHRSGRAGLEVAVHLPGTGIATVNKIVFPAHTPVNFRITSDAVMNSFFIPGLGGQIYAMAGMQTKLHLIADRNAEMDGISANYSGAGFTGMKFKAIATTQEDFDAWGRSQEGT
jgi:cytochrome o ubiquinol oxidase subunit 2